MAHDLEKKWRSQDVRLKENADFSSLLLNDRILNGLTKAGFKKPSPIQLEAIPLGLFGKDLLVQAKSGTGKTLVFVTVALQMLRSRLFRPQILVLAPTREIATQIESVVKLVGSAFPKLNCHSFIGGLSVRDDTEKAVTCQFVVGTPGRIKQLITMKALPTNSIRLLVFDEADQLFHKTFKEDIDAIFKLLPEVKQVIATSATYPPSILKLISLYLSDPSVVCLNARELALLGIVHYAKVVKFLPMPLMLYNNKLAALEDILKRIKFSQCLIFCNGIHRVEVLYRDIKKWGFSATYISSKKEQCDRLKAIDKLKHFKCKVLVSSDLTARGIDAENVDLVINFDLALNTETYMHRVGRAGRYGAIGVAFTIIDENEIGNLKKIEDEGSFKCYQLPDPVPRDLILNPSCGEYVIPDSEGEEKESTFNDVAEEKLHSENLKDTVNGENGIVNDISNGHNEKNSLKRNVRKTVSFNDNLNKTDILSSKEDVNCIINTSEVHDLGIREDSVSNGISETEILEQITSNENGAATINALEAHDLKLRDESVSNGNSEIKIRKQIASDENGAATINALEALDLKLREESVKIENSEIKIREQIASDENGAATINALEAHDLKLREESVSNGNSETEILNIKIMEQIRSGENGEATVNALEAYDSKIREESVCNGNAEAEITEQIKSDENGTVIALPTKQKEIENKKISPNGEISDCISDKSVAKDTFDGDKKIELSKYDIFNDVVEVCVTNSSENDSHAEGSPKVYKSHSIFTEANLTQSSQKLCQMETFDTESNVSNKDNELENNNKNLKELEIVENVTGFSENKSTAGSAKDDINVEHLNTLNHAVEMFINKYEINESLKSTAGVMKEESFSGNDSGNKITESMIHNLSLHKNKYFYNVFKKFRNEKNISETSSENRVKENVDNSEFFQVDGSEQGKCGLNFVDEPKSLTAEDSLKELESEDTNKCLGKPNYESTPQKSEKTEVEKVTVSENVCESKTVPEIKVVLFSQQHSDESESSETGSDTDSTISDKGSSPVRQNSSSEDSKSISDKDSSDDESESEKVRSNDEANSVSSSSTSSSSGSCSTDNVYVDMLDTGRRNPSLVMSSSENLIDMKEGDTKHVRDQRCQRHNNTRFHRSNGQPKHGYSRNPHSAGFSGRRQQIHENNLNVLQDDQEHLACPIHHSLKCFLPSAHRCHPNTVHHTCSHRQLCSQWYNEFHHQWHQIQSMLH